MKAWLASLPKSNKIVLASLFCISVLLLSYLCYQSWGYWIGLCKIQNLKDQYTVKNDFIKTVAQVLGGAFFLFGLYFTWQNLVVSQERQRTDLFTRAIEQLGSDKLEVRLGGIYALERIARESSKDHWPIMEVLTTFVRVNAPLEAASELPKKPALDIQAVLTVLGRTAITYRQKGEQRHLDLQATHIAEAHLAGANLQDTDLSEANLQGANLVEATLKGAHLGGANLQVANLQEACLERVDLSDANLNKAELIRANLRGAHFYSAQLQGAILCGANLQWAQLLRANLQGANLERSNLQEANLVEANLQEANLVEANLQGANLVEATLKGAHLGGANLKGADLGDDPGPVELDLIEVMRRPEDTIKLSSRRLSAEQVAEAYWDETTRWPAGFTPPPRKEEKK